MREATQDLLRRALTIKHFNPRLPCGRRLGVGESRCEVLVISIPASHARSDGVRARVRHRRHFNPHSPCGELSTDGPASSPKGDFNPTLPMRGATSHDSRRNYRVWNLQPTLPMRESHLLFHLSQMEVTEIISTHAPHAGSDHRCSSVKSYR